MRQAIITFNLIGSFVIYALSIDLFDNLIMFLLFGIVPGKNEQLSANQMLLLYTIAAVAVTVYYARPSLANLLKSARPLKRQVRAS